MENNHHHHHFSNMCEKIFGAIYPALHKNHHQDYSAPATIPNHHPHHHGYGSNSYVAQTKPSSNGIPPNRAKATSQAVQARHMPNLDYHVAQKENSGGVDDINNAFSDYINHAKIKIRAVSNVGDGEEIASGVDNVIDREKEDDAEDEFSSYINRAKVRMKKTSSVGSRNMISFKRE